MYEDHCEVCHSFNLALNTNKTSIKSLQKEVDKAYKTLHEAGSYSPEDISKYKGVIEATNKVYQEALTTGIKDNAIPGAMLKALQKDTFLFSALKTHAQLTEASRLLLDKDKKLKSFQLFSNDIQKIKSNYNENYLEAEYNFAVASAQMAGKWSEVESNDGRYNIQYRTAGDDKVRDSHRALDLITLPSDDAFWNQYYPPNGWRCRCTAVEVLKSKYTVSDSNDSIEIGNKATTLIGKNGKNKLEIFRFNPGKEKVIFPPKHPYGKVVGAKVVKDEIAKSFQINVSDFIKGDLPTNNELKNLLNKYAEMHPENFRNGLDEVRFAKSKSYMMQHSMAYDSRTNNWVKGSKLTISNHTFSSIDFNPLEELRKAFGAIKQGRSLSFKEEYAFESLWHEVLHAKTNSKPYRLSAVGVKSMETLNQFCARHSYPKFIESFGGKASNQSEILKSGFGYSNWVSEFRNKLSALNISEEKAFNDLYPELMSDYSSLTKKMYDYTK